LRAADVDFLRDQGQRQAVGSRIARCTELCFVEGFLVEFILIQSDRILYIIFFRLNCDVFDVKVICNSPPDDFSRPFVESFPGTSYCSFTMSLAPSTKFNPILARYLASLEKNPLRTKATTTGTSFLPTVITLKGNMSSSCPVLPSRGTRLQLGRRSQKESVEGCPSRCAYPSRRAHRHEGSQDGNIRIFYFGASGALPRRYPPEGLCWQEGNWRENCPNSGKQSSDRTDPGLR
jgi:hypothetical protein